MTPVLEAILSKVSLSETDTAASNPKAIVDVSEVPLPLLPRL